MLSHAAIWYAIDALAARHGLTPSGLARRAGLSATTFNPSKRISTDGRARWPSTESIAKVLEATGERVEAFFAAGAGSAHSRQVPLIDFDQAGDGGFPLGPGRERIAFPDPDLEGAYALEISGDGMEPLYRDGDTVIVAPGASLRRGDRVIAKTRAGELMVKMLGRRTADAVELIALDTAGDNRLVASADIGWIARIVWASQ